MIDHFERADIRASTASRESLFLSSLLKKYRNELSAELNETLANVDLFGVDLPFPNALVRRASGRPQIVVFEGLLQLVRFFGTLVNACALLSAQRADVVYDVDGEAMPEADLLMMAGHSILADFVGGSLHVPAGLLRILGPKASSNARIGLEGSIVFVLAHEAGHVALGHVDDRYPVSERPPDDLAYREDFDGYKESELQADRFALSGMLDGFGDDVISSVLFFMSPFSFVEAFAPGRANDHPLTVNRLRSLAGLLRETGKASRVALDIVTSQADGIEKLIDRRRAGGGDILKNVEASLPVREAYAIMEHIENRVLREHGPLDVA